MASAARFAKLNERELPETPPPVAVPLPNASAAGIWRPLSVTMLNCGPKPRAVTTAPSPLRRSMETPVIRCSASLRFVSGNLPMSSALIASTTPTASRLVSIEALRLPRRPVTTTSCSSSPCAPAPAPEEAGLISTAPPTMVNSAFDVMGLPLVDSFIVYAPPRVEKPTVCSARQRPRGIPSLNAKRMRNAARRQKEI